MEKLFGTDGIRGLAYEPPLDDSTVSKVGRALAENLDNPRPRILIGRDTRESGSDIEAWLCAGIASGGGEAVSAGVLPTPAIAYLTATEGWDAGVVLSASHNPYRDNGIKIFEASGNKMGEELEALIERRVHATTTGIETGSGARHPDPSLESAYLDHLVASLGEAGSRLPPLRIALDCANGAAYRVGPTLLERLGIETVTHATEPNGRNINEGCGSTHIDTVAAIATSEACDFGAALDGDGDRLLLVDSTGRLVDGDAILLLCARRFLQEGRLRGAEIVATVMSNMALEIALRNVGIRLLRTKVGDKYVAQEMSRRNIMIGGEQSGHLIFSDFASTGDGLLTLMQVLRVLALEERSLEELAHLEPFPQILVNVRVRERPDVGQVPEIADVISEAERQLDGRGRVLIRYSGTEPLLRIMIEGPEKEEIEALASNIGEVVEQAIGEKT
jgi:phosphoglucosamine mutase